MKPSEPTGSRLVPGLTEIEERLAEIRQRIEAAAAGRTVDIVAVTKTFPVELTDAALAVGLNRLGENYAKDLVSKADDARARGLEPEWHFIGGLQSNKVKSLVGRVAVWETMDRPKLLDELAKRSDDPTAERVYIQVNTTLEDQKSGCRPDQAAGLVEHARSLGLQVEGLMTIGPTGGADPRGAFDQLNKLADEIGLAQRSMGMSGDYELAVSCGATVVRIGSALFGPRSQ